MPVTAVVVAASQISTTTSTFPKADGSKQKSCPELFFSLSSPSLQAQAHRTPPSGPSPLCIRPGSPVDPWKLSLSGNPTSPDSAAWLLPGQPWDREFD